MIFLKYLLKKYPCIVAVIFLICSLASQQSTAMLELAMFLPVLLRVILFHLAITSIVCSLASPIFLKYISWQKCEKVKDALMFDCLGFIPTPSLPMWQRHATPLLKAYKFSSFKWWWQHLWRSNELRLTMFPANNWPVFFFLSLFWVQRFSCKWYSLRLHVWVTGVAKKRLEREANVYVKNSGLYPKNEGELPV